MKTLMRKATSHRLPPRVEFKAPVTTEYKRVLTQDAMEFVARLEKEFGERRRDLLHRRWERQVEIIAGRMPQFLPGTKSIRNGEWTVAPIPKDLRDRRVEITGPTDRKTVINALNSGANVYMADFEDANSPTWENMVKGQINLCDAVDRTVKFISVEGKEYRLGETTATLMVRPRGWHMVEKHVLVDGHPISASIFDFGIFLYHNARNRLERGSGPYFYLPKLESHLEARLWNDIFLMAQDELGIPRGSIRATVLIENILAAFEMDEILHELSDHAGGLNCGRWDYIFSIIKKFRHYPEFMLPDRSRLGMANRFLHSFSLLLIKTCHRRAIHAIGGMAAQIPVKGDAEANEEALVKIRADKVREARDGHDGTWVAHPALVSLARDVFNEYMPEANQIRRMRYDVEIEPADLLSMPKAVVTEQGLRANIRSALLYFESWFRGIGCVPVNNLVEDTATAEISRAQIWQWLHHQHHFFENGKITIEVYRRLLAEEFAAIQTASGLREGQRKTFTLARELLNRLTTEKLFPEFFTLLAYDELD